MSETLPGYAAPPLFETVFGVRFPRLRGWDIRHLGLFWDHVKGDYPEFEVQQPLAGPGMFKAAGGEGIAIRLVTEPDVRCWYLTEDRTRLLQVQHDAFLHNWRKVTLDEVYPRYVNSIRPSFEAEWARFQEFLASHGIASPRVVECEATYVNHFEQGKEWESMADLAQVLNWWQGNVPVPETVRLNATTIINDCALDITLSPAVRRQDEHRILQFNLTVKGQPESSETSEIMAWMDKARAAIVLGFTELTSPRLHDLWKRNR